VLNFGLATKINLKTSPKVYLTDDDGKQITTDDDTPIVES
jgi:hypothetical protein